MNERVSMKYKTMRSTIKIHEKVLKGKPMFICRMMHELGDLVNREGSIRMSENKY